MHKKVSSLILSLIIGGIVVTFVFSGMGGGGMGMQGNNVVASVDGTPIDYREYRRALESQIQFYSQISGGKSLTQKQIQQFGIKDRVLGNLIKQKLLINLGKKLQLQPSQNELTSEIKKLPYFQTGGKFDVTKYKGLLAANRYSPTKFEELIESDLIAKSADVLLGQFTISDGYVKDILKFKNQKFYATAIKVQKNSLKKHISVSKAEISKFIANKDNGTKLESRFARKKRELDQPEEVNARHILLSIRGKDKKEADVEKAAKDLAKKVRKSNFAKMAEKYTEDPSGKGKGGSLGWFGRGRMVPEFDKTVFSMKVGSISAPIKTQFGYHIIYLEGKKKKKDAKLADHQNDLAKELIRESKDEAFDKLIQKLKSEFKTLAIANKKSALEKARSKYDFQFQQKESINRFDGQIGSIKLDEENVSKIFQTPLTSADSFVFENAAHFTVVAVRPYKENKFKPDSDGFDVEKNGQLVKLSRSLREKVLKKLQDSSNIKQNPNLL